MNIIKGSVVTLDINPNASNTFLVDTIEDSTLLLKHPLSGDVLFRVKTDDVNKVGANIKDSTERTLDYVNANRMDLDMNTRDDLDGLALIFVKNRNLTPRQKQILAQIGGTIASVKFRNDLKAAMTFVVKNQSVLDEFNLLWFNNFKPLFLGRSQVTSQKQRNAIFNIAGHVLAELENPTAPRQK